MITLLLNKHNLYVEIVQVDLDDALKLHVYIYTSSELNISTTRNSDYLLAL